MVNLGRTNGNKNIFDEVYTYTEKNIVNFNKYLVEYCQLNIY